MVPEQQPKDNVSEQGVLVVGNVLVKSHDNNQEAVNCVGILDGSQDRQYKGNDIAQRGVIVDRGTGD